MELLAFFGIVLFVGLIFGLILLIVKANEIPEDREDLAKAHKQIGALEEQVIEYAHTICETKAELELLKTNFKTLQNQKISADVKMGQKAENLLPFLESFPYKDDELRGLFNPIDLIVFKSDEVVFVEVKSGQSQLSEKQRQIRDNIQAGRVRFEIHRMDEKGVKIK